jgi:hypothetical protein
VAGAGYWWSGHGSRHPRGVAAPADGAAWPRFPVTVEDNDTKADLNHRIVNENGKVEALALGLTDGGCVMVRLGGMVRCGPRHELVAAAGDAEVGKVVDIALVVGMSWSSLDGDRGRDTARTVLVLSLAAWWREKGAALDACRLGGVLRCRGRDEAEAGSRWCSAW